MGDCPPFRVEFVAFRVEKSKLCSFSNPSSYKSWFHAQVFPSAPFLLLYFLLWSFFFLKWQGTKRFMAPEVRSVAAGHYDEKADIWFVTP
jgi:hypothetical protein